MRLLGIFDHELGGLKKWGAELGALMSLSVFCAGHALNWMIEIAVNDVSRTAAAVTLIVLLTIGAIVFGLFAWFRWKDIRTAVDTVREQSTDHVVEEGGEHIKDATP